MVQRRESGIFRRIKARIQREATATRHQSDLGHKLSQIQNVFDLDGIQNLHPDTRYIQEYYKANQLAYSLFHTLSDQIHMGISRDGVYKPDDLLEAARFVEKYIIELDAKQVVELATGRGATSSYLAERFPDVLFHGIDLSPGQLDFATKKAKRLSNYHPELGDYHDLSRFKNDTFDIAFEIEAVCHSQAKERVFEEAWRILKPGGVFVLLDGYLQEDRSNLDEEASLATIIAEKGMAVPEFEVYNDVLEKAEKAGFTVIYSEDVSQFTMPTLRKFEKLARSFFSRPTLARTSRKMFPETFLFNAISGYLMPDIVERGIGKYYITVLKRRN